MSNSKIEKFSFFRPFDVKQILKTVSRPISKVFWHCSASDNPEHDNAQVIELWHKARNFNEIGYHAFVCKDGRIQMGRDWNLDPAAQSSHNKNSLAFCLHGLQEERFTSAQKDSMYYLSKAVNEALPGVTFHGHKEVANKDCPVINYKAILNLDNNGKFEGGLEKYFYTNGTYQIFDRGEKIKQIQQQLNKIGGFKLVIDGVFGKMTELAVINFQKKNGLDPDGIVGPKTLELLYKR